MRPPLPPAAHSFLKSHALAARIKPMSKSQESTDLSANMVMKVESGDGLLIAAVSGPVSATRISGLFKEICDTAVAKGFHKILIDCAGLNGDLSVREKYAIGKELADHQSNRMSLKIALVGEEPAMTGVGVAAAQNRGLDVELFYDRQRALAWLARP